MQIAMILVVTHFAAAQDDFKKAWPDYTQQFNKIYSPKGSFIAQHYLQQHIAENNVQPSMLLDCTTSPSGSISSQTPTWIQCSQCFVGRSTFQKWREVCRFQISLHFFPGRWHRTWLRFCSQSSTKARAAAVGLILRSHNSNRTTDKRLSSTAISSRHNTWLTAVEFPQTVVVVVAGRDWRWVVVAVNHKIQFSL